LTSRFTGACRWEVPSSWVPPATSEATASGRIFDGPDPKRPSNGWMLGGRRISGGTARVLSVDVTYRMLSALVVGRSPTTVLPGSRQAADSR
jgi:hypothetical protein